MPLLLRRVEAVEAFLETATGLRLRERHPVSCQPAVEAREADGAEKAEKRWL